MRAALLGIACVSLPCLLAELVDWAWGLSPDQLGPAGLGPGWSHPLGTDALGRDQLSRLLHGGRVSLAVAAGGAVLATVLGTGIGAAAGYLGGRTEWALMRLSELWMALPKLPVMILLSGLASAFTTHAGPFGQVLRLALVIGAFSWMDVARLTRAETRRIRRLGFVLAAEGLGASRRFVLRRHVLPHLMPSLGVALALELRDAVLFEAILSFLGLGVAVPTPSWGRQLAAGWSTVTSAPWVMLAAGAAVFVWTASVHLGIEAFRSRQDPALGPSRR